MLHDAQREVAVREGRPDPGPLVPSSKRCTEASRKRAVRESAVLQAEVEQAHERRRQELRDGLAWSPLPGTPPGPPPAAPQQVRPTSREAVRDAPPAAPWPEPRRAAAVAPETTGEATATPRKRRPRPPAGFIDMIGTVPSSRRR